MATMASREDRDAFPGASFEEVEDSDVAPRDSNILQAILGEGLTVFTFDGLKRLLRIHQEILSRALDRLEDEGLVEKVVEGYRVTERGGELVTRLLGSASSPIPIVQSLLPQNIEVTRIISGLKGRWFGSLRWLGYSQTDEGVVLKWITEEGGIQVDAKFTDAFLSIEAKVGEGKEVSSAVKASYQLLGYISRLYMPRRARNLVSPVAFYPDVAFA